MRLLCLKNEFVTNAVKYSIDHILNQLGYFYDWIEDPASVTDSDLLIIYGPTDILQNERGNTIHLPRLKILEELSAENIDWQETYINKHTIPVLGLLPKAALKPKTYFCDLAANIYFHLARLEERDVKHPDQLDDQRIGKSILRKYGNFTLPVADMLIADFGQFIEQAVPGEHFLIRKAAFPEGEDFGLAITHDVDRIAAFHRPTKLLLKILNKFGFHKKHSNAEMDQADQASWAFDRLLPFYLERQIKATFFFISRWREGTHFRYLLKQKRMLQLFETLKKNGHEIALHPSRYAFEHPKRYLKEKQRLEKSSGFSIRGMRHHYLRGLFPQLWQKAADLELKYDATLIHRHHSGFRSATCNPFIAFDHEKQELLPVQAFPTAFFENTLPKTGQDVDASLKTIRILLEQTKKHQGLFTILWHTNNIYYNEPYPQLWQHILQLLENENAFSATLYEHQQWFVQRKKIRLTQEDNELHIEIPQGLEKFSLLFPHARFTFNCRHKEIKLRFKDKCLFIENKKKLRTIYLNMKHG